MSAGMSLDEYVKATLIGIVRAVTTAQADENVGGYIGRASYSRDIAKDESENAITQVSFDLATTVEEAGSAAGGLGVKVIPFIRGDVDAKISGSQSTVSRIAFQIPVAVPRPAAQREEDRLREQRDRADAAAFDAAMARRNEHSGY